MFWEFLKKFIPAFMSKPVLDCSVHGVSTTDILGVSTQPMQGNAAQHELWPRMLL